MTNDGSSLYNVTLIVRLNGSIGTTIWAKVAHLTIISSERQSLSFLTCDVEDNTWITITYKFTILIYSALLKYDGNGNIISFFIFGKPGATGDYYLYHLEIDDMKYIDNQNIIIRGKSFFILVFANTVFDAD